MIPSLLKYSLFYCICYRFEAATSSESLFFLSAAMYKDNYAFHASVVTNSLFAAVTIQGCTKRGQFGSYKDDIDHYTLFAAGTPL